MFSECRHTHRDGARGGALPVRPEGRPVERGHHGLHAAHRYGTASYCAVLCYTCLSIKEGRRVRHHFDCGAWASWPACCPQVLRRAAVRALRWRLLPGCGGASRRRLRCAVAAAPIRPLGARIPGVRPSRPVPSHRCRPPAVSLLRAAVCVEAGAPLSGVTLCKHACVSVTR